MRVDAAGGWQRTLESRFQYSSVLADEIERRWQDRWEAEGTFHTPNPTGDLADASFQHRSKFYVMDMFPYPSGAGLHVGHPLGYIATDVIGRYRRMAGDNVLYTMGFDAYGLPAELHAIQTGEHPRDQHAGQHRDHEAPASPTGPGSRRAPQLRHDRPRVRPLDAVDLPPDLRLLVRRRTAAGTPDQRARRRFRVGRARPRADGTPWADLDTGERRSLVDSMRLAYADDSPVNWCPGLGTVLSKEEVTAEGRSERGNFPVFTRHLYQWKMRITAYADRLVDDLDRLDWPESIKKMQRNWIGRSHGAQVSFASPAGPIEVFTTRPDTLFGATYMVLSPEHPMVDRLTPQEWPADTPRTWTSDSDDPRAAVHAYRKAAAAKTDVERQKGSGKTGVFIGAHAVNPVNGERIPVFVADYVLMGYGTGAIMAVPSGDQRDHDFATAYGLPIVATLAEQVGLDEAYMGEGTVINSADDGVDLNGLSVEDGKATIIAWLQDHGHGAGAATYRLNDWLFSRQRYWGEPFPIVYDEDNQPVALPDSMLPLDLPEVPDYSPLTFEPDDADSEPEPPLARAGDWVNVTLDLGDGPRAYRRETNTMPNWAGSSWYELRYPDPHNDRDADRPRDRALLAGATQ